MVPRLGERGDAQPVLLRGDGVHDLVVIGLVPHPAAGPVEAFHRVVHSSVAGAEDVALRQCIQLLAASLEGEDASARRQRPVPVQVGRLRVEFDLGHWAPPSRRESAAPAGRRQGTPRGLKVATPPPGHFGPSTKRPIDHPATPRKNSTRFVHFHTARGNLCHSCNSLHGVCPGLVRGWCGRRAEALNRGRKLAFAHPHMRPTST